MQGRLAFCLITVLIQIKFLMAVISPRRETISGANDRLFSLGKQQLHMGPSGPVWGAAKGEPLPSALQS